MYNRQGFNNLPQTNNLSVETDGDSFNNRTDRHTHVEINYIVGYFTILELNELFKR